MKSMFERRARGSSALVQLLAALTSVLVIGLVAAGCGSSDDSSGSTSGGESGGETAGLGVEPRTIGVVDIIRQSPIDNALDEAMELAGDELGWDVEVSDAGGDPEKANQAAQVFVTKGVDAIVLISIEANAARAQIASAEGAGIPVIEIGAEVKPSDLWDAQYGEDERKLTQSLADYIFETEPEAQIGDLTVTAIANGLVRKEALEEAVEKEGKASIVASAPVDLTDPVTSTEQAVSSMLTAHPDLSAIHAVYDNFLQAALQTVTNKRSDAKVYSYFTAPETVKALKSESPLQAVADDDLATTGMIAFDQLLGFFENGTEIDPEAAAQHPLEYVVVSRDNIDEKLGNKDAVFPTPEIVAPWIKQWESEYGN
jgi:ribose transport system substrate-binding protein